MFYFLSKLILGWPVRWIFRLRIEGVENIPKKGPVILASNHLSIADHFFLPNMVRRRLTFLAKKEHFDPWYGFLYRWWGAVPIDRKAGGDKAMVFALEHLKGGGALGIYPEGTRSRDGQLHRGKTGAVRLALNSGAKLIPVTMIGTFEILPPEANWPKFRPCTIIISPALELEGDIDDHQGVRRDTNRLMRAIGAHLPANRVADDAYGE